MGVSWRRLPGRPHDRRRAHPLAAAVRLHHRLAHHLPEPDHRAGQLSDGARGAVAEDRPRGVPAALSVLGQGVRHLVRHGRRLRRGDELRVRRQLVGVLRPDRAGAGTAAGLRGAHRLLSGGELPRRHAVRLEEGRAAAALRRHLPGGRRHADVGLLDHLGQQLDAVPGQLRPRRAGSVHRPGLDEGDLLAHLPHPLRPHGAGGLSLHRPAGRRGLGVAAAAGPERERVADRPAHGHRPVRPGGAAAAAGRRRLGQGGGRSPAVQAGGHRGLLGHPARGALPHRRLARPGSPGR